MEWSSFNLYAEWLPAIIPGIVFLFCFNVSSWRPRPYKGSVLLAYMTIAAIYLPLTEWILGGAFPEWRYLAFLWGIPAVAGLLFGWAARKEKVRDLCRRCGIYLKHPSPTAWDYVMGVMQPKNNAYFNGDITLKNGTILKTVPLDGHLASSSETPQRDVYVESVDKGEKAGYYIADGEISMIKVTEVTDGQT